MQPCYKWIRKTQTHVCQFSIFSTASFIKDFLTWLLSSDWVSCYTQVMVMQEGSTSLFGQHLKLPTLPSSSLTLNFSDGKKNKSFSGAKVSLNIQVASHNLQTKPKELWLTKKKKKTTTFCHLKNSQLFKELFLIFHIWQVQVCSGHLAEILRDVKHWLKSGISWLGKRQVLTLWWRKLSSRVSRYRRGFEWTVKYL